MGMTIKNEGENWPGLMSRARTVCINNDLAERVDHGAQLGV